MLPPSPISPIILLHAVLLSISYKGNIERSIMSPLFEKFSLNSHFYSNCVFSIFSQIFCRFMQEKNALLNQFQYSQYLEELRKSSKIKKAFKLRIQLSVQHTRQLKSLMRYIMHTCCDIYSFTTKLNLFDSAPSKNYFKVFAKSFIVTRSTL